MLVRDVGPSLLVVIHCCYRISLCIAGGNPLRPQERNGGACEVDAIALLVFKKKIVYKVAALRRCAGGKGIFPAGAHQVGDRIDHSFLSCGFCIGNPHLCTVPLQFFTQVLWKLRVVGIGKGTVCRFRRIERLGDQIEIYSPGKMGNVPCL